MNVEIDSRDVIKLVLQFLKENNMSKSLQTLQLESNVSLNIVDNVDTFLADIQNGHWDSVLPQVSLMQLPRDKLTSIYEQVILELLEAREIELSIELLRISEPILSLKLESPERYLKLERLCLKSTFNANEAYEMGSSKERRRHEIAESLVGEVSVVPPSRLLALIGQALNLQQSQGLLPRGQAYDLFKGGRRSAKKESEEKLPKKQSGQIKFDPTSHPETIIFSPDGQSLVTGSIDGFIEGREAEYKYCLISNCNHSAHSLGLRCVPLAQRFRVSG